MAISKPLRGTVGQHRVRARPVVVAKKGRTFRDNVGEIGRTGDDDELVEVTPNFIRLRKRFLLENERKRNSR